jgi:hypothetical protein
MSERIISITHRGKEILLVDLSNCSASEVEKIVRALPDHVTARPRGSVLILADFTGATLDAEARRAMKESAVFNKPHVKKSAWVGAESLAEDFHAEIRAFSRREFTSFKTQAEAMAWLVED